MKFLLDAQLPRKLSDFFIWKGYDAIHTLDLPDANKTKDSQINDKCLTIINVIFNKI